MRLKRLTRLTRVAILVRNALFKSFYDQGFNFVTKNAITQVGQCVMKARLGHAAARYPGLLELTLSTPAGTTHSGGIAEPLKVH